MLFLKILFTMVRKCYCKNTYWELRTWNFVQVILSAKKLSIRHCSFCGGGKKKKKAVGWVSRWRAKCVCGEAQNSASSVEIKHIMIRFLNQREVKNRQMRKGGRVKKGEGKLSEDLWIAGWGYFLCCFYSMIYASGLCPSTSVLLVYGMLQIMKSAELQSCFT